MNETEIRARLKVLEEAVAWIGAHIPTLQAAQDLRHHLTDSPAWDADVEKAADALVRRMETLQQKRS